ncbi:amidase family protein [Aspergillus melleus]|uniref:amidase family protein n=1 Tax=Aspergillus melleus TaxID=138277 RepID=UPI001E8D95A5|nr:uncharacterized protein LDX57_002571 [Aspergillus melleus]KAH8424828.1 hypothetical protein LDX57_002571 [Aspergillus melleus]
MQTISIFDAKISDLQHALNLGQVNSVQLTAAHFNRIAYYDRRQTRLNSTPVINEKAFEDAQWSDQRRATGRTRSMLDGIPCTIKDSYKVEGMTVASGSPAFKSLVANENAFTVQRILDAGGVILGRTNMPPMAAGGMQRGLYGRAESPYNEDYLTAAFASGSSNGSATSTAASLCVFGMGEETISSGRSPASNNGLVAYTPSRGLISIRGNWPLFPICDTVVPHTRNLDDMFSLLDVIVADDETKSGDFWRGQPFVSLPRVDQIRPRTYHDLADAEALVGKKIGVPKMYIGGHDPAAYPVHTRQSVIELWSRARACLESLGATVHEVDFPIVTEFEGPYEPTGTPGEVETSPIHRANVDMCKLMAYAWDDFLIANNDQTCASTLAIVDSATIFPRPKGALPDKYASDDPLVRHTDVVGHIKSNRVPIYEIPGLGAALKELEARRKATYEDWLDRLGLDVVVWPCAGDVGKADADTNEQSAKEAWRNGVLYSNGNCAIRQLGVPTVSVPMGVMRDTQMPVNLTFASKAYDDNNIFRYAYAYETASRARQAPKRTPLLASDTIPLKNVSGIKGTTAPELSVQGRREADDSGLIDFGTVRADNCEGLRSLEAYVDGKPVKHVNMTNDVWETTIKGLSAWGGNLEERGVPSQELAMVIVTVTANNGRSAGKMLFL